MKTYGLFLLAVMLVLVSCDNNPGVSKAFRKYSGQNGVTSISVPGWVVSLAANMGDLEKEERNLLRSIDKVKVLTVEDESLNSRINLHEEFHAQINAENEYEELVRVKEKGEDLTIYGKMEGDVIREMIILVGGNDNTMVYLKGKIEPEMLASVSSGKSKFMWN